jgi:hypothetical protein
MNTGLLKQWKYHFQKQDDCLLDSRGRRHLGLNISAIVDCIAKPIGGIMCGDIMNMQI